MLCDNLPFNEEERGRTNMPENAMELTPKADWKTCSEILGKTRLDLVGEIAAEIIQENANK